MLGIYQVSKIVSEIEAEVEIQQEYVNQQEYGNYTETTLLEPRPFFSLHFCFHPKFL